MPSPLTPVFPARHRGRVDAAILPPMSVCKRVALLHSAFDPPEALRREVARSAAKWSSAVSCPLAGDPAPASNEYLNRIRVTKETSRAGTVPVSA